MVVAETVAEEVDTNPERSFAKEAFAELYPLADEEELTERFFDLCDKYADQRAEGLRSIDQITPEDWYKQKEAVGYILYADLFTPDQDQQTHLQRLKERLDYFEELGVNVLHILPALKNSGDAGFAVDDYQEIDPSLGTMEQFEHLAAEAHERGIRIMFDFVLNHTSDNHFWAEQAKKGDKQYQSYYIMVDDEKKPDWPDAPDIFPDQAPGWWDYVPELDKWVFATFYKRRPNREEEDNYPFAQWDLNYRNPEVLLAMTEEMLNLANKGVDVFRLDAVPFLWKREDTNCQSEPELHKILQLMRVALNKVAPSAAFMAESCQEPEELIEYFGEEQPEVNLAYNFDLMGAFWHAIATGKVNKMSEILKEIEDLPPQVWWSVFTECHDEVTFQLCNAEERRQIWDVFKEDAEPFRQREGESVPWGMCGTTYSLLKDVRKVLLMEAVKFSLPGLPLLYMGEELAVENDYSFRDDPQKAADRRFLKRVQLSDQVRAERSDEGPAKEIFQGIKKLIEWRKRNQLVGNNFNVVDTHNEHVLGFSYHQEKKGLFCFANFSNKKQSIKINDGNGGELVVELNPYQFKSEKISAE